MYSKEIKIFKPVDIKLLKSIDEIFQTYYNVGIKTEDMEDSNIERGEICQICRNPSDDYYVGFFNKSGSGKCYYTILNKSEFIEGIDFIFV